MQEDNTKVTETEPKKMLGGSIPESVYWRFKEAAATRKETMVEALTNAALMYIDVKITE
jgi:hypothetical protein